MDRRPLELHTQRDAPDAEQAKPTYLKLWRSGSRHGLRIERSGDEECNDRTPLDPRGRANTIYVSVDLTPTVVFLYPSAHRASHARTGPTLHRASHARTGPTLNETHVTLLKSHRRPTSPALDRPSRLFLAGRSAAASLLLFLCFPLFPPSPPPHRHLRNRRQSARIEIVFVLRSSPRSSPLHPHRLGGRPR